MSERRLPALHGATPQPAGCGVRRHFRTPPFYRAPAPFLRFPCSAPPSSALPCPALPVRGPALPTVGTPISAQRRLRASWPHNSHVRTTNPTDSAPSAAALAHLPTCSALFVSFPRRSSLVIYPLFARPTLPSEQTNAHLHCHRVREHTCCIQGQGLAAADAMTDVIVRTALLFALVHPRDRSDGQIMDDARASEPGPASPSPADWRKKGHPANNAQQFTAIGLQPVIACDECHKRHSKCLRNGSQACTRCVQLGRPCRTDRPIVGKSLSCCCCKVDCRFRRS